ncbi:hypothetical protein NQ315_010470 [Exocentrus adspersus]|uniref:Cathepsin L n=1 Tax=Exocentrus adspersus TaxID=1586481 RepID=A0AAV8W4P4_9CUCU|nr:hypothetical protein NQ315_010470 [Exocentrus adspersus]
MKVLTTFLFCIVLANAAKSVEEEWNQFKVKHGRSYRSRLETSKRFGIFKENLRKIEDHNNKFQRGEVSYNLAINKFADLTEEEFKARLNPHPITKVESQTTLTGVKNFDIPDEIDWNKKGAVTRVKDQGNCGGCWAFGATGALEAQYFLKTGQLVPLSEQYLIDCSTGYNNGCKGGWIENAYLYIRDKGIVTEESYPYEEEDKVCRVNGTLFKHIGFVAVQQNEEVLKAAVANKGPVAVSIDASFLSLYGGGVFDNSDCNQTVTNHAVLVAGYGTTEEGVDFWLVKNSWGADWGEDGYLKMSRNKDNQCAIASTPLYPVI